MITEKHQEFARAVVALARRHNVSTIKVSFRNGFPGPGAAIDAGYYTQVTADWASGRHGDQSRIVMRAEGSVVIEEQER